jgi:hypothetical protein
MECIPEHYVEQQCLGETILNAGSGTIHEIDG